MTSEANRAYVMEKIDVMTGHDVGTKINNDDMLRRTTTEDEATSRDRRYFENKITSILLYAIWDGI